MVNTLKNTAQTTIVLTPNRSATWREIKLVMTLIGVFVMLVAFTWAIIGVWLVLPFAGLEVGLLAYFMYRVSRQCHAKQVIIIGAQDIIVEWGFHCPVERYRLARQHTHLLIKEATSDMDKAQLVLTDENLHFEVGQFLNQQDCVLARQSLIQAGIIPVSDQWWKQS